VRRVKILTLSSGRQHRRAGKEKKDTPLLGRIRSGEKERGGGGIPRNSGGGVLNFPLKLRCSWEEEKIIVGRTHPGRLRGSSDGGGGKQGEGKNTAVCSRKADLREPEKEGRDLLLYSKEEKKTRRKNAQRWGKEVMACRADYGISGNRGEKRRCPDCGHESRLSEWI